MITVFSLILGVISQPALCHVIKTRQCVALQPAAGGSHVDVKEYDHTTNSFSSLLSGPWDQTEALTALNLGPYQTALTPET